MLIICSKIAGTNSCNFSKGFLLILLGCNLTYKKIPHTRKGKFLNVCSEFYLFFGSFQITWWLVSWGSVKWWIAKG